MCAVTVVAGIYPEPFIRLATYSLTLARRTLWPLTIQIRSSPAPPDGGPDGFARQLANVLDLPFVLVGSVVIGAALGYFLDRRLRHLAHVHVDPRRPWDLSAGY